MTSKHDDWMSAIEQLVDSSFTRPFTNLGFLKASISRNGWNTIFTYLGADMGFEVEIDWRDGDVFVLLLRLEDGKPPDGYYVSNGKRSRVHLESCLSGGQAIVFPQNKRTNPAQYLESKIQWYARQIEDHGSAIVHRGVELFSEV